MASNETAMSHGVKVGDLVTYEREQEGGISQRLSGRAVQVKEHSLMVEDAHGDRHLVFFVANSVRLAATVTAGVDAGAQAADVKADGKKGKLSEAQIAARRATLAKLRRNLPVRVCTECGHSYKPNGPTQQLCAGCRALHGRGAAKKARASGPRLCRDCGGAMDRLGAQAVYCGECAVKRTKAAREKWYAKNRATPTVGESTCKDCGATYQRTSNRQQRCEACVYKHRRVTEHKRWERKKGKQGTAAAPVVTPTAAGATAPSAAPVQEQHNCKRCGAYFLHNIDGNKAVMLCAHCEHDKRTADLAGEVRPGMTPADLAQVKALYVGPPKPRQGDLVEFASDSGWTGKGLVVDVLPGDLCAVRVWGDPAGAVAVNMRMATLRVIADREELGRIAADAAHEAPGRGLDEGPALSLKVKPAAVSRYELVPVAALERAQGELKSVYVRLAKLEVAVREHGVLVE
jgi:hypothetical protein